MAGSFFVRNHISCNSYVMYDYEETLRNTFHLSYLRPSQEMLVTRILENAEAEARTASITSLPTGGGKSLCFLLPAAVLDRPTILLYPLKSLMNDQARRLDEAGIPYTLLRGGMERGERTILLRKMETGGIRIMITNMEMLLHLTDTGKLDFLIGRIELFVMDEAHTIIQWKDSFRPCYQELGRILRYLMPHQALCFTATLDEEMKEELKALLFPDMETEDFTLSPDRDNVFYHSIVSFNKREDIRRILTPPESRPAVVFCMSRKECEERWRQFRSIFPSAFYHAGLERETKKRLEKEFAESAGGVMFATNAYGMGVDVSSVRTVIHTRLPKDPLSFLQESGRGGRDGLPYDSYVLHAPDEEGGTKEIFSGERCIRNSVLEALDIETESTMCTSCSVCSGEPYVAAGMKEMMHALRLFPLLPMKALITILSSPLAGKYRLRGWSRYEMSRALTYLRKRQKGKPS